MAAQDPETVWVGLSDTGTSAGLFLAVVTSEDTVALTNFTDILHVYVINLSDNSVATATTTTNVVKITEAGLTTAKILIFAQGT